MSLDPPAVLSPTYTPAGVPTIKLRVLDTEVHTARRAITRMLAGLVPATHLDDLELCASELVTNAIRAARDYATVRGWWWHYADTPVYLDITCGPSWTRLDVRDPDPAIPDLAGGGLLDESGRGLALVGAIAAAVWPTYGDGKVMHAVIPMPKVTLTADELREARQ